MNQTSMKWNVLYSVSECERIGCSTDIIPAEFAGATVSLHSVRACISELVRDGLLRRTRDGELRITAAGRRALEAAR